MGVQPARLRRARMRPQLIIGLAVMSISLFIQPASAEPGEPRPTTSVLTMNADGSGKVTVKTSEGSATGGWVDVWVGST